VPIRLKVELSDKTVKTIQVMAEVRELGATGGTRIEAASAPIGFDRLLEAAGAGSSPNRGSERARREIPSTSNAPGPPGLRIRKRRRSARSG